MSEYQYYEFQAVDRPLTTEQMRELRSWSTRATITATSFINEYNWGDFKGNEDQWMAKYFDAFLYLANWGTRVLKLRWPSTVLPPETAELYCCGDQASVQQAGDKTVVSFTSYDQEAENCVEGAGHLAALLAVRDEVARGDLRALYLGWLLAAQSCELDEDAMEPPVPPNLGRPTASQQAFVEFLRVDEGLLAAARHNSSTVDDTPPDHGVLADWVAGLPSAEKDALMVRLVGGEGLVVARELLSRLARERRPGATAANCGRVARSGRGAARDRGAKGRRGRSPTPTRGRRREGTVPGRPGRPGGLLVERGRQDRGGERSRELWAGSRTDRRSPRPVRSPGNRECLRGASGGPASEARSQVVVHPPAEPGPRQGVI